MASVVSQKNTKNSLKLSILIPVFNAEAFLHECLDSVASQTLSDFEAILINDGSTDSSLKILQDYAQKDARFKILDKSNSGYGDSLNQALKIARGEYIGIVEPDDFIEPNMYEVLYRAAIKNDADLAKASFYHFYGKSNKNFPEKMFFHGEDGQTVSPKKARSVFLTPPSIWSAIYRRKMLEENQIEFLPSAGASYQDVGFAFKTFALSRKVYCTNLPLYHYRRDNSASSVKSAAKIFAVKTEFDAIDGFLSEHNLHKTFFKTAAICRFRSYLWNYNRLKLKTALSFARTASQDYKKISAEGFKLSNFNGLDRAFETKLSTKYPRCYLFLRPLFCLKNWSLTSAAHLYRRIRPRRVASQPDISDDPLVTIAVAVYNIEKYLPACLDSILAQTYSNLEIIVVDDGSEDDSAKICDDYKARDDRIKVIHQKNAGLSAARNIGLEQASSEFIAFIDGDDCLAPTFISELLAASSSNVDIAVCGYNEIPPLSKTRTLPPAGLLSGLDAAKRLLVAQEGYDIVTWNKLYRTKLFRDYHIQYPLGVIHEDALTTYKLYAHARQVASIARPLYSYCRRGSSIMGGSSVRQILVTRENAAREAISYFSSNSQNLPSKKEFLAAAEVSLLLAKFAFLDAGLSGDIPEEDSVAALAWIRAHAHSFSNNVAMTKKLKTYLRLIKTPNASAYKVFRRLKH
ncbi:glycosyltransferase [Candidatus Saccharibacteria bacterium]|nr:glycosyltransferase [Candidatus Saccharibacteria bacterium]MBQ3467949.1 glycosyltransferase [Candidatus Saccharibacteria bacterium]